VIFISASSRVFRRGEFRLGKFCFEREVVDECNFNMYVVSSGVCERYIYRRGGRRGVLNRPEINE